MKTRYFIFVSYKGTSYHGWQVQPNGITVQQILDEALSVILDEKVSTTGAGRTDTGVHALVFCAHFDSVATELDIRKNFIYRLNSYLPKDISVSSVRKVKSDSNARFSALSRTYTYYISRQKDPFTEDSSWYLRGDLDIHAMNRAAALLLNHTDFTSFSRLHTDVMTNNCRIMHAGWEESEGRLIFTIMADRFLRNMVRAIVGTMADVGSGKITGMEFDEIIRARDRRRAGRSAPAKGLFLSEVEYPADIFI
ncbi:MAG: tRNA pseudouridine(38-40) synthase TruA [Bacteroidales bacterium]|jgi:tRNA pseudouridine38-40 synthase